jgi:hypothetical protein
MRFSALSISGNEPFRAVEKNALCFIKAVCGDRAARRFYVSAAAEIGAEGGYVYV